MLRWEFSTPQLDNHLAEAYWWRTWHSSLSQPRLELSSQGLRNSPPDDMDLHYNIFKLKLLFQEFPAQYNSELLWVTGTSQWDLESRREGANVSNLSQSESHCYNVANASWLAYLMEQLLPPFLPDFLLALLYSKSACDSGSMLLCFCKSCARWVSTFCHRGRRCCCMLPTPLSKA